MKKFVCLLGIFLMLILLAPAPKAEAFRGHGWVLPGLLLGGVIGWSLSAPRYYYPPPAYYYPPPAYYYPPPAYYYPPPNYSSPPPAQTSPAPSAENQVTGGQIFIYPRQGQSEKQMITDRTECHNWAMDKTGYDPTKAPPSDMTPAEITRGSSDYHRALGACLDGRGYSMR